MQTHILRFIALILFTANSFTCVAQEAEYDTYEIYAKQVYALWTARGAPPLKISNILNDLAKSNISKDADFAKLLSGLYPESNDNGFIFYFFDQDNLRTVFFTPGKVIEQTNTPIKKEALTNLVAEINDNIGLYSLAKNRTPKLRGVQVTGSRKHLRHNLDSLIAYATRLLLPKSFNSGYKHLTIIPALNIGTFPFHILRPYGNNTYLIENCSFMVAPGVVDLVMKRINDLSTFYNQSMFKFGQDFKDLNITQNDSIRFTLDNPLLVGNPQYPTDSAYFFPDLPGAEKEIRAAAKYAKNYTLLTGKNATKDSVLAHLGTSDVAYFATHGIASDKNPMNKSFIVLSGKSPYLTAKEIMDYHAESGKFPEMIILSACQTGLGLSMDAGIAGLARSFLFAGSHDVIMSLWNVDDEATSYLMGRFIVHLQEPNKYMPSDPLRLAIIDTMKIYPKISQWAGFSAFGNDYGN